ncbi:MAG: histidine--tRNA ligase [Patescibacteria group bacterium]
MTSIKSLTQLVKGMHDILPIDQIYIKRINNIVEMFADAYGFSRIDLPVLEYTDLFIRGTGKNTDIVEKEMYSFKTKGGDMLSLRPEFTPGMVRAYIEHGMHNLSQPIKLYTIGSLFRHENPQKGRYREHRQFNFDIFGGTDSALDAEIIFICWLILENLGLKDIVVKINSIGCNECKPVFRSALLAYYRSRSRKLCNNCSVRIKFNPLRVLDCKEEKCQQLKKNAPQVIDHICEDCKNHFKSVLEFIDEMGVPYFLDIRLVRGLDYYSRTVFEFVPKMQSNDGEADLLSQSSIGGGGRYDNLVSDLSGKDAPAVGCGIGIERLMLLMKEQNVKIPKNKKPSIFLIQLGDLARKKSFKLFEELRRAGLLVIEAIGKNSIKSQLKMADRMMVPVALIFGQKEVLDSTIIIRDMISGVQEVVPLEKIIPQIKKYLKK